ncbi:unnamed protein product [Protopolystoma xenopodis]|uniref:Uncharacterized protein n=1 Tax=Protopolystoma xenopodis TaxID=117903 RepID=A0A448XI32_9PLAT|nr:unnamed protein product [Protopolystoma xenopodis]
MPSCISNSMGYLSINIVIGLIRCLALHSVHTWLASGTSRGHLVSWDLRYQRPVTFACHPQLSPQRHDAASLLALRIVQPGLYYPTATTSSIAGSSSQGSQEPSQQPLIATSTSTTPKNVWRANWNIITEGVGPNFPPDTSRLLNSAGRQQISNLPGAASHTQVLVSSRCHTFDSVTFN